MSWRDSVTSAEKRAGMDDDVREQAKRDELQFILIREGLSLITGLLVFWLLTSPKASMWLEQKVWQFRQARGRAKANEAAMLAELRRDISRFEHGEVSG